ncbi:hypothetical protein [Nannocystis pusilla]|uniref:hypothetical protein n=1 Tax=Nannocystis pusilla TaxID=889268 RepID=UPI003B76C3DA
MFELDAGCTVVAWNRQAELVFGTAAAATVGRDLDEVVPLTRGSWRGLVDDAGPKPKVWEVRHGEATRAIEAWVQVVPGPPTDPRARSSTVTTSPPAWSPRLAPRSRRRC